MEETRTFVFESLPTSVEELQSLPEYSLETPLQGAALALAALMYFETDRNVCYDMIDALRGPDPLTVYAKQFIRDRLGGKMYVIRSFFAGSSPSNSYTPTLPYRVTLSCNFNIRQQNDRAVVFVRSSGADSPRPIRMRLKPSEGRWYVTEIQCLSDIRTPADEDPWA